MHLTAAARWVSVPLRWLRVSSMQKHNTREKPLRNSTRVMLSFALAAPLVAPSALAEGGFDTYFSDWYIGTNSRQWTDKNLASVTTNIFVKNCTFSQPNPNGNELALRIYRYDAITPDDNMGTRDFEDCEAGETRLWSDMASAKYYFKLAEINDGTDAYLLGRASANPVKVRY